MSKVLSLAAAKARQLAEKAGTWFEYRFGGRFKVAYHRNADYSRRLELFRDEERQALKLGPDETLPIEARNRSTVRAMFGTLLLDWEEVFADEEKNERLEFTIENALELLLTDVDLAQELVEFAQKRENHHRNVVLRRAQD